MTEHSPPAAKPPVPAGSYVELGFDKIDRGSLLRQADAALRSAFRDLKEFERCAIDQIGKATVSVTVTIQRVEDTETEFEVIGTVRTKSPALRSCSLAKGPGDTLICQPGGSSSDTPDQMRLFDGLGHPTGRINLRTGELTDEPETAGAIHKGAG